MKPSMFDIFPQGPKNTRSCERCISLIFQGTALVLKLGLFRITWGVLNSIDAWVPLPTILVQLGYDTPGTWLPLHKAPCDPICSKGWQSLICRTETITREQVRQGPSIKQPSSQPLQHHVPSLFRSPLRKPTAIVPRTQPSPASHSVTIRMKNIRLKLN